MIADLVRVTTADGYRLDGALHRPAVPAKGPEGAANGEVDASLGIDALLCVHGTGGSFYSSTLFEPLIERFLELGCAALVINTRGHDLVSTAATSEGPRRQGAAYELVDACRHDLAAWADLLRQQGYRRVSLVGHSLGAVKSVYALANDARSEIARLVAVSPPRLSCSYFSASSRAAVFQESLRLAQSHIDAGRPRELLQVDFPLPYLVTAEGFVDKYGPAERYNIMNLIDQVSCPTLVTLGALEVQANVAFTDLPDELARKGAGRPLNVELIAGADHFYSGVRKDLVSRVESWLRSTATTAQ